MGADLKAFSGKKALMILLSTKFIYGTRILTIIYMGIKGMSFKDFLFNDFLIGLIWMSIIVLLGWFAGNSFKVILGLFKNVQLAILSIVIFITMIIVYKIWSRKKFIKMQKP